MTCHTKRERGILLNKISGGSGGTRTHSQRLKRLTVLLGFSNCRSIGYVCCLWSFFIFPTRSPHDFLPFEQLPCVFKLSIAIRCLVYLHGQSCNIRKRKHPESRCVESYANVEIKLPFSVFEFRMKTPP